MGLTVGTGVLAVSGLFWAWRDAERRRPITMLAATATLYLLGLAPLYVHDRLVVAIVPIFLIFLAVGLVGAARRLTRDERALERSVTVVLVGVGALSLASLRRASSLDYSGDPVVQREAGEWLAAHYPQGTRIMAGAPSVGFYFYDEDHLSLGESLPWADTERTIAIARERGVRILAIPEWHLRAVQHPAADVLLHPDRPYPALRPIATLGDEEMGRMFVYEIVPPPGDGRSAP
jgi:hypothetical protein